MKKNLYSIPASLPFADILARWILDKYGRDPAVLPGVLVLLPSRRACLALREAFLRATGGAPTLLPRMQPLGEVDEDRLLTLPGAEPGVMPHPAFASKRLFLLARLVRAYQSNVHGKTERMDHAVAQAREIAQLLDKVEREGASLGNLAALAPDHFSAHWQLTTEFLSIVAEHWPAIAAEKKLISPEHWRNESLLALAAHWTVTPSGSSSHCGRYDREYCFDSGLAEGNRDAAEGVVILPGLDLQASDGYMEHVSESHAQWGMRELLTQLGFARDEVTEIGEAAGQGKERVALLSRALAPAEMLGEWRNSAPMAEGIKGLAFLACADEQEEAQVVALLLREVLETQGKTAALVTHDRALARRVSAEMQRYRVQIDDSAGQALGGNTGSIVFTVSDSARGK